MTGMLDDHENSIPVIRATAIVQGCHIARFLIHGKEHVQGDGLRRGSVLSLLGVDAPPTNRRDQ